MKKFTKLFLSCALVSVVAMATAAMASAEAVDLKPAKTNGLEGTYDEGVLELTLPEDIDTTKEATLLVVEGGEYTTDTAVVGIDQATGGEFDKTGLKGAPTEAPTAGYYTVMLGYYPENDGTFTIAKATLFGANVETIDLIIGSTSLTATELEIGDATNVARKAMHYDATHAGTDVGIAGQEFTIADEDYTATKYIVGSTVLGNELEIGDATNIARKAMHYDATHAGTDVGYAGQTITVEAPAAE